MIIAKRTIIMASIVLSSIFTLRTIGAQQLATGVDPSAGPWYERSDAHFRFVYKKADESLVEKYLAVSDDVYRIVTGYMQLEPKEKPVVFMYGAMDSPPFGGMTANSPMRIGLEANDAQVFSPKTLLMHEFTHYMEMSLGKSGVFGKLISPFMPEASKVFSLFLSDLSLDGATSFIDGYRRTELASLPVRAAVLEGQLWDYDKVATGGLRQPTAYRTYLSQMLVQDWLFDHLGTDALLKILDQRDKHILSLESKAFREYTGIDFKTAWGDIRSSLEERYAFARALPLGESMTPRDGESEPQWGSLIPTQRGFLHYRRDLGSVGVLGFWQPQTAKQGKAKKTKPEILKKAPGRFVPLEGLVASDVSVDARATTVAAIVTDPADSSLYHDRNRSRIVLAGIEWNRDFSKAKAVRLRDLPGSGFASPCLCPDGSRLFATLRFSDIYRAAEIDMATGKARALAIPAELSVEKIAASPDGRRLALAVVSNGEYDVGLYDLESDSFSYVTHDPAMDFAPVFLSDGSLAFSSDRENSVSVYRFSKGGFSREIVDAIAAFSPVEDGQGGYYYSSYSAYGRVIRRMGADKLAKSDFPGFSDARPAWLDRRDLIWDTYSKKGLELESKNESRKKAAAGAEPEKAKPFIDASPLQVWSPEISLGDEGFGLGASAQATSYLGEQSYSATVLYYPDAKQAGVSLGFTFLLPFMQLDLRLGQSYYGKTDAATSVTSYHLERYASIGAGLPLVTRQNADGSLVRLSAVADAAYSETMSSANQISFVDEWSLAPRRAVSVLPGLSGKIEWPAPATSLSGGSFLKADLRGLYELSGDRSDPGYGGLVALGAGVRLGTSLLSLSGKGAYREYGSAHELIPRAIQRWESGSVSPYYAEAGLSWAFSALKKEESDTFAMLDQEGIVFGLKAFGELDADLSPRLLPELEFSLDYVTKFVLYYNAIPISFGVSYRCPLTGTGIATGFDPSNLCFKIGFSTKSFAW
jgi:hypothetical protein